MFTGQLVARIDRTQAAKLYAGNIEYGYFVRGMEARCQAAGMSQYTDASQLINMAASLSEDALRCTLSSCQCNISLVACSIPVLCEQLFDLAGQRFGLFHANSSVYIDSFSLLFFLQTSSVSQSIYLVAIHTYSFTKSRPYLTCGCTTHREAVRVKSKQAWHAAVRHTGLLFQLEPPAPITSQAVAHELPIPISIDEDQGNEPEAPAKQQQAQESVQSSLPYPQLQQTISNANFAPAAHLVEHYSSRGGDRAMMSLNHLQNKSIR